MNVELTQKNKTKVAGRTVKEVVSFNVESSD